MGPDTAMGLAALVIFLIGGFLGYLYGKGRIVFKTRLLEKNMAKAQMLLEKCKDKTAEEIKELLEKAKECLNIP
uniref:Uncharacterized protein n=1 Tax=viral metagenome TaxID=1070528 RepID=A0A6M3M7T0_9ZZZZ